MVFALQVPEVRILHIPVPLIPVYRQPARQRQPVVSRWWLQGLRAFHPREGEFQRHIQRDPNNSINSTSSEPAAIIVLRSRAVTESFLLHHGAKDIAPDAYVAVEIDIDIGLLTKILSNVGCQCAG